MRRLSAGCKLDEISVCISAADVVGKLGFSNSDDTWVISLCSYFKNRPSDPYRTDYYYTGAVWRTELYYDS